MNRIRQLREKKKLTQRKFVTEFNSFLVSDKNKYKDKRGVKPVTFGTASRWENNLNQPTESMWNALADFFDVSVSYLKGYGYSKEYIYQQLDQAYKENWKDPTGQIKGGGFKNTVDAYLKQAKIKKPSKINEQFWKDNFNFIFDNPNIDRLLTTKDSYSDNDIKLLLEYAIFLRFATMKQIIDYYNNN